MGSSKIDMKHLNKIDPEVLIESESARQNALSDLDDNKALIKLYTVEKSIDFKNVDTSQYMTTKQVADLYQVKEATIQQLAKRNKKELEKNGLKTLSGKDLKSVTDTLSVSNKARKVTLFTPRTVICVGMLLSESEVAEKLRYALMDLAEKGTIGNAYTRRIMFAIEHIDKEMPFNYWNIFDEVSKLMGILEKFLPINKFDLIDGSVGRRWGKYRKYRNEQGDSWLEEVDFYDHPFPDKRGKKSCKCYHINELPKFREWFHSKYVPEHLFTYLSDKYPSKNVEELKDFMKNQKILKSRN